MANKDVLDFPEVTDRDPDDIFYNIRGSGSGSDKKIQTENLFIVKIEDQTGFNSIIEYVSANRYKIIDSVIGVDMAYLAGGYQMAGATSPLSGGDLWGYIETNNCKNIKCDMGTFIDYSTTEGYFSVNTAGFYISNLELRGDISTASAVSYGFQFTSAAIDGVFFNCIVSNRKTNHSSFTGFGGSAATAAAVRSTKLINCVVREIHITTTTPIFCYCFKWCNNLLNCEVNGIYADDTATANYIYTFYYCSKLNNILISNIDSYFRIYGIGFCTSISNVKFHNIGDAARALSRMRLITNCSEVSNIIIDEANCTTGSLALFSASQCINNIKISNVTGSTVYCFDTCKNISASNVLGVVSSGECDTFRTCIDITACHADDIVSTGTVSLVGFIYCENISASMASNIVSTTGRAFGFYNCNYLSGCLIDTITGKHTSAVTGFYGSDYLTGCYTNTVSNVGTGSAEGFTNCLHVSSVSSTEALNAGNNFVDSDAAAIGTNFSCAAVFT